MPAFRAYCLDGENYIIERLDFDAQDDEAAIAYTRRHRPGVPCEIWEMGRKVAQLAPVD